MRNPSAHVHMMGYAKNRSTHPTTAHHYFKWQTHPYLTAIEYERIRRGNTEQPTFRGPFDATYDLARDIGNGADSLVQFADYRLMVCDELHDLNEAGFRIICALILCSIRVKTQ